jgi:hypothetical protein
MLAARAHVKSHAAVRFHRRVEVVNENDEMIETGDHRLSFSNCR